MHDPLSDVNMTYTNTGNEQKFELLVYKIYCNSSTVFKWQIFLINFPV